MEEIKVVGMLDIKGTEQIRRVYSTEGVSPTISTMQGGNRQPKILVHKCIAALRGREPTDRTIGVHTSQRLEPNFNGLCNTLTTVQKDNLVMEKSIEMVDFRYDEGFRTREEGKISPTLPSTHLRTSSLSGQPFVKIKQNTKAGYEECKIGGVADLSYPESKTRRDRVQNNGDTCPTITAQSNEICRIETEYRIRKLTPKECWRLMGFTDEDFEKASKVNSNTQLYKQAGNSIVVNVLEGIFKELINE